MNHYRIFFEKGRYNKRQAEAVDVINTTAELANIEAKKYLLSKGLKMFKRTNTTLVEKNVNVQVPIKLGKTNVQIDGIKLSREGYELWGKVYESTYKIWGEINGLMFEAVSVHTKQEILNKFNISSDQFESSLRD